MKIYRQQTEIYDIRPEDSSTQRVVHMGENVLNLTFRTTSPLDLHINDYVVFENTTYKFKNLCNPTRRSRHEYEYICQLFSPQYDLQDVLFIFEDETGVGVLDETVRICETADLHLQQIVKCIKTVYPEWTVGDIEQTSEVKNVAYAEMNCLEALQHMAEEFNVEYWITGTSISIGKKKYGDPIAFKYGKGNALYELSRQNQDGRIVTALRVRGSDRNIDSFQYGSKYLHLPNNEHYVYQNVDKYGIIQDRMSFPEIYPRLIHKNIDDPGRVTSVRQNENGFWFVKDDNINKVFPDLNIELLDSQTLVVDFQTGELAGMKIDVNWHKETGEYELIVGDYGLGQDIPSDIFVPAVGDLYLLSNLKMPQAYIDAAEQELYEAGVEAIKQLCEQKVSYKGPVNPLFFRLLNETIETGRAVVVEDDAIVDGAGSVELRIQAYTRSVNDDLTLDIEISDTLYVSRIDKIENTIKDNKNDSDQKINYGDAYTKRRWRDAKETFEMLENAQLNFSESINPITVQTMQLLVGDESLQFRYVNGRINPVEIDDTMRYNNETRTFRAGINGTEIIQHMTLGIDTLSPSNVPSNDKKYKFWDITPITELIPDSAARYIYLKCSKTNEQDGRYVLSKTSIKMEEVTGYYHFLAAILNSEYEGARSFVPMYGFTEITPGQMRVNKIISSDGTQYWDMLSKRFKIGNANSFLSWNEEGFPNQLRLKGTIVQSPSGDTDYLPVDRGDYVHGTPYYPGDTVRYLGNVYKCTYPNSYIYPTNTSYWKIQISKGDDGNTVKYIYRRYPTQPATPSGNNPSGWSTAPYSGTDPMWISQATFNSAGTNISGWSVPIRWTGENGADGKEGQGYMYAYKGSNLIGDVPQRPTSAGGYLPSGWSAAPNIQGFKYMYQTQCVKTNGLWSGWSQPVLYNYVPEKGDPGPGLVFRGWYVDPKDPTNTLKGKLMYNNAVRRDVVQATWDGGVTSHYYIYKGQDAKALPNTWDGSMWESFGAQFNSVATDLLFTPNGHVGGWIFKNEQMESQTGGAYLNGKTGEVNVTGKIATGSSGNRIVIDPVDKSIKMYDASDRVVARLYFVSVGNLTTCQMELTRYDINGSYGGRTVISPVGISTYAANDNSMPSFQVSVVGTGSVNVSINPDKLPTSDSWQTTQKGDIWRDGNTLKIKTTNN